MTLLNFKAKNVHGYLDFDIDFFNDLSFLTGLNGTGKTTALNLIIALITPSFKNLITTNFKYLELKCTHNNEESIIRCEKIEQKLYLSINEFSSHIDLNGLPVHDESEDILHHEFRDNKIIDKIHKIPTPMFLDLNRRFIKNVRQENSFKNREMSYRRKHNHSTDMENNDLSLVEVEKHISGMMSTITRGQLRLAEKLKKKILRDSFTLQTLSSSGELTIPPLERLVEYKKTILSTLDQLELLDEDETLLDDFFDSMGEIIKKLNSIENEDYDSKKEKDESKDENLKIIGNWLINQPQLERVIKLTKIIKEHQDQVKNLEKVKENFLNSINGFYEQTNKKLIIKDNGNAEISIEGQYKDINYLSSGERQLLIILSHLYLNKNLPKSGVFIIDEPELSLHLLWQEMFVDEMIKAKPDLQIILATHSPAIIKNKKHKHVPLNKRK